MKANRCKTNENKFYMIDLLSTLGSQSPLMYFCIQSLW